MRYVIYAVVVAILLTLALRAMLWSAEPGSAGAPALGGTNRRNDQGVPAGPSGRQTAHSACDGRRGEHCLHDAPQVGPDPGPAGGVRFRLW